MAIHISFITPRGAGSIHAPVVGPCRIRESIASGATTTAATQEGEVVLVVNEEAEVVFVAVGATPNASATASTALTTAGVPVPPNSPVTFYPPQGSRVSAVASA